MARVVLIHGARQAGKTILTRQISGLSAGFSHTLTISGITHIRIRTHILIRLLAGDASLGDLSSCWLFCAGDDGMVISEVVVDSAY